MGNCYSANHIIKPSTNDVVKFQPIAGNVEAIDEFVQVHGKKQPDEVVEFESKKPTNQTTKIPKFKSIDDSNVASKFCA
jgi:hypothetical protein